MKISITNYSNANGGVEVKFVAESGEEKALLGALATNSAKFGSFDRFTNTLFLHGKVS